MKVEIQEASEGQDFVLFEVGENIALALHSLYFKSSYSLLLASKERLAIAHSSVMAHCSTKWSCRAT